MESLNSTKMNKKTITNLSPFERAFKGTLMKKLLFLACLMPLGSAHSAEYNDQKTQYLAASNIVQNQDYDEFKSLLPAVLASNDAALIRLVDKQHKKYFGSRYNGIANFKTIDFELIEQPQDHSVASVRRSVEKWGATKMLRVKYSFDTTIVRTQKEQSVGGYCEFGYLDDNWYMLNLLK